MTYAYGSGGPALRQPHQQQPMQAQWAQPSQWSQPAPWGQPMQGQWGQQPMPPRRPVSLTAAGVLAFVAAGIEIIGGIVWLAGGALVGAAEDAVEDLGGESSGVGAFMVLLALASFALGGCYIWGGVSALGGRNSRVLFVVASLVAVVNLVALVSAGPAGALGLTLAVVVIGLLLAPASRLFVRANGGKTV